MEIETDKATVEIEAAASGILAHVRAKAGDEVPVGQTIALILAPGETHWPQLQAALSQGERSASALIHPLSLRERAGVRATRQATSSPLRNGNNLEGDFSPLRKPNASPKSRESNSDRCAAAAPKEAFSPRMCCAPQLVAVARPRGFNHARNHPAHAHAPHRRPAHDPEQTERAAFLYQHGYRHDRGEQAQNGWKEQGDESIPSINDFILQACARALKDFPSINSSFTEQGIQHHADINIGMAVALEEGLVVPVIRNADRLSLKELATAKPRSWPTKRKTKNSFRSITKAARLPCPISACSASIVSSRSSIRPSALSWRLGGSRRGWSPTTACLRSNR